MGAYQVASNPDAAIERMTFRHSLREAKVANPEESESSDPIQALEFFVMNNPELDEIESQLSRFNIFETLNIAQAELRHSSVLAWLMSPDENHGLRHHFLKRLLQTVVSENRDVVGEVLPVLELDLLDYSDIEIRREWENIDLLVVCRSQEMRFVVAIENKILSDEHDLQLIRYRQILSRSFPKYPKLQIFLSPDGRPPSDDDTWIPLSYSAVLDCIEHALKQSGANIGEDVLRFIEHYTAIVRRYVVGKDQIEKLCRRIYAQHPKALDLIFEYRPDLLADVRAYLVAWIARNASHGLKHDSDSKTAIRFFHDGIDALVPRCSTGWTKSKRLILFEFTNYYDGVTLRLYIGPGPTEARERFKRLFEKDKSLFKLMDRTFRKKWHATWQRRILTNKDVEGAVFGDLEAKLERGLNLFLKDDLPAIIKHFDRHRSMIER